MKKIKNIKFCFLIISLILFSFISIFFFIINHNYRTVYNLNLNVHCNSVSSNIFKSIFKGIICNSNLNIDSEVPEINLLVNPKNLLLSKTLMGNIISNNFENYTILNKRFKTNLIYKDKIYKAKIKFHGKNPSLQHIKGQFFSMDVRILEGKSINGLTSFDLILKDRMNPRSLFFPIISSNKLIYQDPVLFKVRINSADWQYFYMQANRDEKFFNNYGLNIFLPNRKTNSFQNRKGFVFEKNYKDLKKDDVILKALKNESYKESISKKYNELNYYLFKNNHIVDANRFFDVEYLSKFLAIFLLLGCDTHGNSDGNLLVGFNFDNGKFYPILHRDYNPQYLSQEKLNDCFTNKQFLKKLFNNNIILDGTINSINSIEKNLVYYVEKYRNSLQQFYNTTLIGTYIYNFHEDIFLNDLEVFSKNLTFIKKNLMFIKNKITNTKINVNYKNDRLIFNEEKFRNSIKDSQINFKVDYNNKKIKLFGENIIHHNIEFPYDYKIYIEKSTSIFFQHKAFLKFHKDLIIDGNKHNPVKIFGNNKGTIIISDLINKKNNLIIKHAIIEKLIETVDDGIRYMGGITVLSQGNVTISNSTFKEFFSEDTINIKGFNKLNTVISKNQFIDVINDGIDLDFVKSSTISNNIITSSTKTTNKNSDGLDFSATVFEVNENIFKNFLDKCVSIGEASKGFLNSNQFRNCNIAIANKDSSIINLSNNRFYNNKNNVLSYIKKKSYTQPISNYVK